jgi:hypothetical protein
MKHLLIVKLFILFLICKNIPILSQQISQTVKGKIIDVETQSPLVGAYIIVGKENSIPVAVTDENGNFRLPNVPVGRYNIQATYVGYEPTQISEVLVSSGKEVVLTITLKQSVTQVNEVTVKVFSRKDRAVNSMASISARSFTVEETRRYAGGLDDPARMASAFAGVAVGNIQDNAIVIRGNSPKGVAWRLEGVDIPNPNHFAGGNVAGGGLVTVFSSQMLSTSDFYTGAFPAEYGNALAGVFDMKLRTGNSEKYEHAVQIGLLGIDIASEGPINKNNNATYLFNYRYSTTGLLSKMNLIPSEQIPTYQDLSFKLNFPTKTAGVFSLWGIGAIDVNNEPDELDSSLWKYDWDRIKYEWKLNTGASGLTHKIMLGKTSYINSTIAISGTQNKMGQSRLDDNLIRQPNCILEDNSGKVTVSSYINHKFSAKHTTRVGINHHVIFYNLDLNASINNDQTTFRNFVKENGKSSLTEFYVQHKYDLNEDLSITGGLHSEYFALNGNYSIEPRAAVKWQFLPHHTLSFGFGRHSQIEELKIYLIKYQVNDQDFFPNKNLEMSVANHYVLGYDWSITDYLRLKIEPYYQIIYNAPGKPNSSFSMLNFTQDWTLRDSLANNSKGKNIGIDFTVERFLHNNFYYLVTFSVFDSKYKASDNVWRNTKFNKKYVFNFLAGKEFFTRKNKVIGLNLRFNYLGGDRYSPILEHESKTAKNVVFNDTKAYQEQFSATSYLDITITYRINKPKFSSVWALQVKNVLGAPMIDAFEYNYKIGYVEQVYAVVVLPILSYKIEF